MKSKTTILAALFGATLCIANPIVIYDDGDSQFTTYVQRKEAESCVAIVGRYEARVSCEVSYQLQQSQGDAPSSHLHVALPVFLPAGDHTSDADLLSRVAPTIESGGKRVSPEPSPMRLRHPEEKKGFSAPDDADVVVFRFLVEIGRKQRSATILVTYVQPAISGRFLYVPLFENRAKKTGFYLDAVSGDVDLRLECVAPSDGVVSYQSRLKVPLSHRRLIEIRTRNANQALQTTPMTRSVYEKTIEFGDLQRGV
ncbi:hypothetical protein [Congregicoccus parvus]|uniref:hypothetical protein n=1 Tax=Congregicoccus parvus TaxID=3081749 RepID=UPI003FA5E0A2